MRKTQLNRGPWNCREDSLLIKYVQAHGEGHWRSMPKKAGLLRCGKSCRLRWTKYLRPTINGGHITADEEDLIVRLHSLLGDRWSLIAGRIPGRTGGEIESYFSSHLSKRLKTLGGHRRTVIGDQEMAGTKVDDGLPESMEVSTVSDPFESDTVGCRVRGSGLCRIEFELDGDNGGESLRSDEGDGYGGREALLDKIYEEYHKLLY